MLNRAGKINRYSQITKSHNIDLSNFVKKIGSSETLFIND